MINSGVKAKDIAILVRKYNSTTVFELSCLYNDLAYNVVADKNIFSEGLFKAIYGYLMLINKGYGFNKHTLEQRIDFIKAMLDYPSLYLKKAVKEKIASDIAKDISKASEVFAKLATDVDKPFKEKNILAIAYDWRTVFNNARLKKADKAISHIIETMGLEKVIAKASADTYSSKSKLQIIEGVASFAKSRKSSINEFIDLLYNLYSKSINQSEIGEDQIQIMSMHRAKEIRVGFRGCA